MKPIAVTISGCAFCLVTPSFAQDSCRAESGNARAALLELYTSEGCSSCPPADQELSQLRSKAGRGAVIVPLALHVTYWDGIGWKDAFAQEQFDLRQKLLSQHGGSQVIYTPQFFLNGRELRHWHGQLPDAIRKTNEQPAAASIALKWTRTAGNSIEFDAVATGRHALARQVLHLAITESRLVSKVLRGENGGATLVHDHTVRAWFAPVRLANGRAQLHQAIRIPGNWNVQNLQAVAFVQNLDDGIVQQAVSIGRCESGQH